jgi:hypothetical protein
LLELVERHYGFTAEHAEVAEKSGKGAVNKLLELVERHFGFTAEHTEIAENGRKGQARPDHTSNHWGCD